MKVFIFISAFVFSATIVSLWYACFSWILTKNVELFPALNLGFIGKTLLIIFSPFIALMVITGGLMSRLLDFSIGE